MDARYRFGGKLLYLRLNRLTHTPPAYQSAQILCEKKFPLLAFEYGLENTKENLEVGAIPIRRYGHRIFQMLPKKLRSTSLIWWTFFYLRWRFSIEGKPKFIVAHGLQEEWLALRLGIPYAVHVHELYAPEDVTGLNHWIVSQEKTILEKAQFLIFAGKERADEYQRRHGFECPVEVVFNGPRLRQASPKKDLREKFGLPPDSLLALYIGGLGHRNALEETILAMETVPKRVALLIAGFGEADFEKRIQNLIQEKKLERRVHLLGKVKDKWDWIDHVDIGICLYQPLELRLKFIAGASNKLFEFISAGVPVVVNSQPDFVKIVSHHELGVCATELTPNSIARALKRLVDDQSFRSGVASRAKQLHRDQFNFDKQFEPVLARYRALFPEVSAGVQTDSSRLKP